MLDWSRGEILLYRAVKYIRMDLVSLARNLLSKVDSFVNQSTLTDSQRFELREEVRAEAKRIAYAIDGPEQAMKSITRGVRTMNVLCCRMTENISTQVRPR